MSLNKPKSRLDEIREQIREGVYSNPLVIELIAAKILKELMLCRRPN
jgi:hypothetical protein